MGLNHVWVIALLTGWGTANVAAVVLCVAHKLASDRALALARRTQQSTSFGHGVPHRGVA